MKKEMSPKFTFHIDEELKILLIKAAALNNLGLNKSQIVRTGAKLYALELLSKKAENKE